MNEIAELPLFGADELSAATPERLIDWLVRHADRVPRSLIDECARRGEVLVESILDAFESYAALDSDEDYWWLQLHAVKILGLIPTEAAGLLMIECMRDMSSEDDENLQNWLAGYWPKLYLNKPASVLPALRALAVDRRHDWYIRHEALTAYVSLARKGGSTAHEEALEWVASMARNEREQWDMRLFAGNLLLDFPRSHNRELLVDLARRQKHMGRIFGSEEVAEAFMTMQDAPDWESRQLDPWRFYEPDEIAQRQKRWADEEAAERKLEQRWIREGQEMEDVALPVVRDTRKVGRNDPCPCGSGKKYKKCCLNK